VASQPVQTGLAHLLSCFVRCKVMSLWYDVHAHVAAVGRLQVYKGLWKGSIVAVKTIVLPAAMSGQEKREKMAIMEAAISSALSHPNIMQVSLPLGLMPCGFIHTTGVLNFILCLQVGCSTQHVSRP